MPAMTPSSRRSRGVNVAMALGAHLARAVAATNTDAVSLCGFGVGGFAVSGVEDLAGVADGTGGTDEVGRGQQ